MVPNPLQDPPALFLPDLLPVQARLEVVIPALAALLCVSGAVLPGDLDPVDLGLVVKPIDQVLQSVVLGGSPWPALFARAARTLVHRAVTFHGDGGMVSSGGC